MSGPPPAAQGPALIWCPFPDEESARAAAKTLLDERLIACANMFPQIYSLFVWRGEQSEGTETGMLLKTDAALLDDAITRLVGLHPYDEPAVLGWRCDSAAPATAAWLGDLLR